MVHSGRRTGFSFHPTRARYLLIAANCHEFGGFFTLQPRLKALRVRPSAAGILTGNCLSIAELVSMPIMTCHWFTIVQ